MIIIGLNTVFLGNYLCINSGNSLTNWIKSEVLVRLGLKSKILSVPLTDINARLGFCTSSPQQGVKYQLWYWKTNCGGGIYKYPKKNSQRQSLCPLGEWIKDIIRAFKSLKCLVGFMHLKPTTGCQISTLIFEKLFVEGGSINIRWKFSYCKVFAYLGFESKILPGIVNPCGVWVGFCT